MKKIVIGVTDGRLYEQYADWMAIDGHVELVRLGHRFNNSKDIERCQGLFMTGGEDVHPRFYHKSEYVSQYKLTDFDEKRDEFELELLARWQQSKIPMLGICRGLQVTNVFLGGTLIPDLPSFGKFNHAKKSGKPRLHLIQVDINSQLHAILQTDSGEVTSMHHQGIDQIAEGLVTNAITIDGVIEGAEWIDPTGKPPIILVQWHPEVMQNIHSPFAKNIRESFIRLVQENH